MKATFIIGCIVGVYLTLQYPNEAGKAWDTGKSYLSSITELIKK